MKKVISTLIGLSLLCACTNKEQMEKINTFWTQQVLELHMSMLQKSLSGDKMPNGFDMSKLQQAIALQIAATIPPAGNATEPVAAAAKPTAAKKSSAEPILVQVFLSNTCPWCKKLKQEKFIENMRKKYGQDVIVEEYEVHAAASQVPFQRAVKKCKTTGGVPLVVVGNECIRGYIQGGEGVFGEAKKIMTRELAKREEEDTDAPAVFSILMEDEDIQGPASSEDKMKMQAYLDRVHDDNEETLKSLRSMFSKRVVNQGMAMIADMETSLKNTANKSATYQAFAKDANSVKQAHQQKIDKLVAQNAKNIRKKR